MCCSAATIVRFCFAGAMLAAFAGHTAPSTSLTPGMTVPAGSPDTAAPLAGPAIVLVEPQLGENVGSAARAMLNCSLTDLRLVRPRAGWPCSKARAMASGADAVLERTRVFDTLEDAVADLQRVYATTARHRDMVKHEVTPSRAAHEIRRAEAAGERCGVLFGRERIGLTNDEVALCDTVLSIPTNPAFSSLNLGQAVLLVAWEWHRAGDATQQRRLVEAGHRQATREELLNFFAHLELALDKQSFFKTEPMRSSTVRTIRNFLLRAELTEQDVKILHGIVTTLVGRRWEELKGD